jgi:hypothetical protein
MMQALDLPEPNGPMTAVILLKLSGPSTKSSNVGLPIKLYYIIESNIFPKRKKPERRFYPHSGFLSNPNPYLFYCL